MTGPHESSARDPQVLIPASRRVRVRLGLGLVALTLVAVLLVAAGAPAAVRGLPVLVVATLLPGYPLVARLPFDLPTMLALDVCASLAVEAALAFVMVQLHVWHPLALALALAVLGVGATLVSVATLRDEAGR